MKGRGYFYWSLQYQKAVLFLPFMTWKFFSFPNICFIATLFLCFIFSIQERKRVVLLRPKYLIYILNPNRQIILDIYLANYTRYLSAEFNFYEDPGFKLVY